LNQQYGEYQTILLGDKRETSDLHEGLRKIARAGSDAETCIE
jgi:hypothetical protein